MSPNSGVIPFAFENVDGPAASRESGLDAAGSRDRSDQSPGAANRQRLHRAGVSIASLGTSTVMPVALLFQ